MNKKMRARKRRQARRVALTLVLMLTVALVSIGGTIAWLTAATAPVVNTFTVGDINITLTETTEVYKMVPGNDIAKDPKVTVLANSEASWLFVKIEKNSTYGTYLEDYQVAEGWNLLADDGDNNDLTSVYYRQVGATTADTPFYVLKAGTVGANGQVSVKEGVTKAQLDDVDTKAVAAPTLTFTAYACQQDNIDDAAAAWAQAKTATPAA